MIIKYNQYKIDIDCINNISKLIILNNFDKINSNFYDVCIQVLENLILNNITINKLKISYNKNVYLNVSNVNYKTKGLIFKNIYYDLHVCDLSYNNLLHQDDINKIYNSIINTINMVKKKME